VKRPSFARFWDPLRHSGASTLVLYAGAIGLALIAQVTLSSKTNSIAAGILFLGALVVQVIAIAREPNLPIVRKAQVTSATPTRRFYAAASFAFAVGAFTLNADSTFRIHETIEYQFTDAGAIAWAASVICFLLAFWQSGKTLGEWGDRILSKINGLRDGVRVDLRWGQIGLVAVLLLGAFFYFFRLDSIPAEMTSDHVEKLLDVNDILEGHAPVFFLRNTGREPFQFYLTSAIILASHLPLGHLALKLGTATFGWLTITITYLLAREMFDSVVALFAAFFMAVSHWMVTISRMGLRFPLTPFFAALACLFLLRALKYQRQNDFLITGLVLGVGLYTYIPSRVLPLLALIWILAWAVVCDWRDLNKNDLLFKSALLFGCAVIVFLPLMRFSLDFPDQFWSRALTRVSDSETHVQTGTIPVLISNLGNLALMFNQTGDSAWPNNIPYSPALDTIAGGLIVLGIGIAGYRALVRREPIALLLLIAFMALVSPSALSIAFPIENPSNVRAGGAIPFVSILVALPIATFARSLFSSLTRRSKGPFLGGLILSSILIPMIYQNYIWYFLSFDKSYRSFAQNTSEAAAVINGFAKSTGDIQHAYHVAYPHWFDSRAIAIQIGDIRWHNYSLDANDLIDAGETSNLLFVVNSHDKENMAKLSSRYPNGQTFEVKSRTPEKDFTIFYVPISGTDGRH
jgi:4-amino-4-deoxy-L-arabinose transferase-like glycosyltransferase